MNGKWHLFGRQNGDVVFEDEPGLLFDDFGVGIFLEVFAGQPEEDILLTVLALEELAEDDATHRTFHQSIERVAPATDFLQTRPNFLNNVKECQRILQFKITGD